MQRAEGLVGQKVFKKGIREMIDQRFMANSGTPLQRGPARMKIETIKTILAGKRPKIIQTTTNRKQDHLLQPVPLLVGRLR